ncbi:MAG: hypothetical protein ACK5MR_17330 [Cumulibacter sp.]
MPVATVVMTSEPWKERLDHARASVSAYADTDPADPVDVFEFDLLLGAFCARRLIEIGAVRGDIVSRRWEVQRFPFDPSRPHPKVGFVVEHLVFDDYLWDRPEPTTLTTVQIFNSLMHCAWLLEVRAHDEDEYPGPVVGVHFTTDKARATAAYALNLSSLLSIYNAISDACLDSHEAMRAVAARQPTVAAWPELHQATTRESPEPAAETANED